MYSTINYMNSYPEILLSYLNLYRDNLSILNNYYSLHHNIIAGINNTVYHINNIEMIRYENHLRENNIPLRRQQNYSTTYPRSTNTTFNTTPQSVFNSSFFSNTNNINSPYIPPPPPTPPPNHLFSNNRPSFLNIPRVPPSSSFSMAPPSSSPITSSMPRPPPIPRPPPMPRPPPLNTPPPMSSQFPSSNSRSSSFRNPPPLREPSRLSRRIPTNVPEPRVHPPPSNTESRTLSSITRLRNRNRQRARERRILQRNRSRLRNIISRNSARDASFNNFDIRRRTPYSFFYEFNVDSSNNRPFSFTNDSQFGLTIRNILNNSLYDSYPNNPLSREEYERITETDIWSNIQTRYNLEEDSICSISQNRFSEHDEVIRINHCGHVFSNLLREWFTISPRCPICRHNLRDELNNLNTETDSSRNSVDINSNTNTNNTANSTEEKTENNDLIEEKTDNDIDTSSNYINTPFINYDISSSRIDLQLTNDISSNIHFLSNEIANNISNMFLHSNQFDRDISGNNTLLDNLSNNINNELTNIFQDISMLSDPSNNFFDPSFNNQVAQEILNNGFSFDLPLYSNIPPPTRQPPGEPIYNNFVQNIINPFDESQDTFFPDSPREFIDENLIDPLLNSNNEPNNIDEPIDEASDEASDEENNETRNNPELDVEDILD